MNKLVLTALIVANSSPARAFFDASVTQTFGANKYVGTKVWADIGEEFHVKPTFNVYKSDTSNGTYKTFQLRGAYDTKVWGAGVTAGGSPKVNGYSNRFFGADVNFSLTPGMGGQIRRLTDNPEGKGPKGSGLARVDVGGAIFHTTHVDELQFTAGGSRNSRGGGSAPLRPGARPRSVNIGQTDLTVNAGVSVFETLISAEVTGSRYDKDLNAIAAAPAAAVQLSGLNSIIQGFPKTSMMARVDLSMFPIVEPYVSLTRTSYYLGAPKSTAVTIGATAGFEILEAHGSIETYDPGGGSAKQTYVSFGGGVRF
ncbi:MAG: hypothetical protein HY925_00580 [Elusimicrobia bacterium]|nr:hypothetical protein [Elusimicrobiota bacterium]